MTIKPISCEVSIQLNEGRGWWIDKEPRADGKPRRWHPPEALPNIDPGRLIKLEDLKKL